LHKDNKLEDGPSLLNPVGPGAKGNPFPAIWRRSQRFDAQRRGPVRERMRRPQQAHHESGASLLDCRCLWNSDRFLPYPKTGRPKEDNHPHARGCQMLELGAQSAGAPSSVQMFGRSVGPARVQDHVITVVSWSHQLYNRKSIRPQPWRSPSRVAAIEPSNRSCGRSLYPKREVRSL
jgi:hypothetical protein